MADLGPLAIDGGGDGASGRFFEDFRNWDRIEGTRPSSAARASAEVAAALMGAASCACFHDHLLVKEPGDDDPHALAPGPAVLHVDGSETVSFWIPLDPVARESTLEFVAGSHASGNWYMPRSFVEGHARWCSRRARSGRCPTSRPTVTRRRSSAGRWSRATRSRSTCSRCTPRPGRATAAARSLRLVGDDVRLGARPHATSPPFPELEGALRAGDELDHPLFPVSGLGAEWCERQRHLRLGRGVGGAPRRAAAVRRRAASARWWRCRRRAG